MWCFDADPGHARIARAGTQHTGEHTEGGCLAGAVGSHDAEELARRDVERETVHGAQFTEVARQSVEANGPVHRRSALLRLEPHIGRQPGFEIEAGIADDLYLHPVDQLHALFGGLHVTRRELGFVGDEDDTTLVSAIA